MFNICINSKRPPLHTLQPVCKPLPSRNKCLYTNEYLVKYSERICRGSCINNSVCIRSEAESFTYEGSDVIRAGGETCT